MKQLLQCATAVEQQRIANDRSSYRLHSEHSSRVTVKWLSWVYGRLFNELLTMFKSSTVYTNIRRHFTLLYRRDYDCSIFTYKKPNVCIHLYSPRRLNTTLSRRPSQRGRPPTNKTIASYEETHTQGVSSIAEDCVSFFTVYKQFKHHNNQ